MLAPRQMIHHPSFESDTKERKFRIKGMGVVDK
jgi:hypothetical protein